MERQIGVYPIQQNTTQQEQRNVQTCDVDESQTNYTEWKKLDKKQFILYDSICTRL